MLAMEDVSFRAARGEFISLVGTPGDAGSLPRTG